MALIAIISDIHSNLEAFKAVVRDIRKKRIKKIFCLGDIVGYGANPNECVDMVRKLKIPCVQGNHDFCSIRLESIEWFNPDAAAAIRWTSKVLTKENREFLKKLPKTMSKQGIFFVHGSPRDPLEEYVFEELSLEDAKEFFSFTDNSIIALGHTHVPFIKRLGSRLIFNPGGVGQPRDGNPKASYCTFDTKTKNVNIQRVEYNIKKASEEIINVGLPHFLSSRLRTGR